MEKHSCQLHISAGKGPLECCLFVAKLADMIVKECQQQKVCFELIDPVQGEISGSYSSLTISLKGGKALEIAKKWEGTMQWVFKSPYRPKGDRKNWFVGIHLLHVTDRYLPHFEPNRVKFETMRSSGPGGQHVNKTMSAVRGIDPITGISTVAKQARSQHANKQAALTQLKDKILEIQRGTIDQAKQDKHNRHLTIKRGNPKMTFYGEDCTLKVYKENML